jgi:hypothetical protein
VFLRLTPDREGAFALRPSPKPRANGAPGRGFVHLGRCGGLELPACKAAEVGLRAIRLPDPVVVEKDAPPPRPRFALEVVVDRATGPSDLDSRRRLGAKDKPEPARRPDRPPKAVARALPADPPKAEGADAPTPAGRPAVEKAAVFLARQLRDAGEASRFIIREIENVHGLKVDDAWLERALGRAPEGAPGDAAEADA